MTNKAKVPSDEKYEAGKILFRAGEMAHQAYLIREGSVLVYKAVGETEIEVGKIHKGEVVGEMALIDRRYHKYNVKALEDTRVTPITPEIMTKKLDQADPLVRTLLYSALYRLSRTTEKRVKEAAEKS
ncbi:MAG: cyclic nucleotide-binding domain-containing protein [Pseudomonadota bacterium]